ncbi:MAG: glutathione S-transferase family protein [Sphingomonadales bacterium]|jgi:glutathione S-transferase
MSKIELFELCGHEINRVFSPYCWTARYGLAHKGLSYDTTPIKFTEKDKIAFSNQLLVPVIKDGKKVIHDSWTILNYLENNYADGPALFPNGKAFANFLRHWADTVINPLLAPIYMLDIHAQLDPVDQDYFRTSREKRFGMPLEEFAKRADIAATRKALEPLRQQVSETPFIEGDAPTASDYITIGRFLWIRGVSDTPLLEHDDPVYAWRERVFDLFDGLGRSTLGYDT